MNELKKCKGCGAEKPLTEFYVNKSIKSGYTGKCICCILEYSREYEAQKKVQNSFKNKPTMSAEEMKIKASSPLTLLEIRKQELREMYN